MNTITVYYKATDNYFLFVFLIYISIAMYLFDFSRHY